MVMNHNYKVNETLEEEILFLLRENKVSEALSLAVKHLMGIVDPSKYITNNILKEEKILKLTKTLEQDIDKDLIGSFIEETVFRLVKEERMIALDNDWMIVDAAYYC